MSPARLLATEEQPFVDPVEITVLGVELKAIEVADVQDLLAIAGLVSSVLRDSSGQELSDAEKKNVKETLERAYQHFLNLLVRQAKHLAQAIEARVERGSLACAGAVVEMLENPKVSVGGKLCLIACTDQLGLTPPEKAYVQRTAVLRWAVDHRAELMSRLNQEVAKSPEIKKIVQIFAQVLEILAVGKKKGVLLQ